MIRIAVVLAMLAACKSKDGKRDAAPPAPAVADAARLAPDAPADAAVADAAVASPDAPPGVLDARVDGVGPITEKTRLDDLKALRALLAGYAVKQVRIPMGEGDLAEIYVGVSKGKTLLLKLVGDGNLLNVDIVSNDVWNPWGLRLGQSFAEVEKLLGKLTCEDGGDATDWRTDVAECDGKLDNYVLDFTGEGQAKELLAKPARLAAAKLVAIRWVVPGNGPPGT